MAEAGPRLPHPLTRTDFSSPVPPGSGWPGDPAHPETAVAADREGVRRLAAQAGDVRSLDAQVSVCRACPRLVAWRERVALEKRASLADQPYWGRPIAGWGSAEPRLLVIGLAPAANGGNRTGRIFTGDRSGDWLFSALHRAGLAEQPTSVHAGDGQRLNWTRMLAAVRCAPPDNKPTPDEREMCSSWLDAEFRLVLPSVRAVICLGSYAWDSAFRALARQGYAAPRPRPRFVHGVRVDLASPPGLGDGAPGVLPALAVFGCYHPSQQNTFTGKLTEPMLDAVLAAAAAAAGLPPTSA